MLFLDGTRLIDTVDLAGPYLVKFGIESKQSCSATSTAKFKHRIVQALRDMRAVCEAAAAAGEQGGASAGQAKTPKAKL
jgi:hypothetical protein